MPARTASSAPFTSTTIPAQPATTACGNGSQPDHGAALYCGLLRAAVYASISTWIGLSFGRWMRGVQR